MDSARGSFANGLKIHRSHLPAATGGCAAKVFKGSQSTHRQESIHRRNKANPKFSQFHDEDADFEAQVFSATRISELDGKSLSVSSNDVPDVSLQGRIHAPGSYVQEDSSYQPVLRGNDDSIQSSDMLSMIPKRYDVLPRHVCAIDGSEDTGGPFALNLSGNNDKLSGVLTAHSMLTATSKQSVEQLAAKNKHALPSTFGDIANSSRMVVNSMRKTTEVGSPRYNRGRKFTTQLTYMISTARSIGVLQQRFAQLQPHSGVSSVHFRKLLLKFVEWSDATHEISSERAHPQPAAVMHARTEKASTPHAEQALLNHMLSTWPQCVNDCLPSTASEILWAAAHLPHLSLPEQVLKILLGKVISGIPQLMHDVEWGLTAAGRQQQQELKARGSLGSKRKAVVSKPTAPPLTIAGLCDAVWASGKLCPNFLSAALPHLDTMLCMALPEMTSAQVTSVVWGLSRQTRQLSRELSETLTEELWSRGAASFTRREQMTMIAAFATWQGHVVTLPQFLQQPPGQPQHNATAPSHISGGSTSQTAHAAGNDVSSQGMLPRSAADLRGRGQLGPAPPPVSPGVQQMFSRQLESSKLVQRMYSSPGDTAADAAKMLLTLAQDNRSPRRIQIQSLRLIAAGAAHTNSIPEVATLLQAVAKTTPPPPPPYTSYSAQSDRWGKRTKSTADASSSYDEMSAATAAAAEQQLISQAEHTTQEAGQSISGGESRQETASSLSVSSNDASRQRAQQLLGFSAFISARNLAKEAVVSRLSHLLSNLPDSDSSAAADAPENVVNVKDLGGVLLTLADLGSRADKHPDLAKGLSRLLQRALASEGPVDVMHVARLLSGASRWGLPLEQDQASTLINSATWYGSMGKQQLTSQRMRSSSSAGVDGNQAHQGSQMQTASQGQAQAGREGPVGAKHTQHAAELLVAAGILVTACAKLGHSPPLPWLERLQQGVVDATRTLAPIVSSPRVMHEMPMQLIGDRVDDVMRKEVAQAACQVLGGFPVVSKGQCMFKDTAVEGLLMIAIGNPSTNTASSPAVTELHGGDLSPQSKAEENNNNGDVAHLQHAQHVHQHTNSQPLKLVYLVQLLKGVAAHQLGTFNVWFPAVVLQFSSVVALISESPSTVAALLHALRDAIIKTRVGYMYTWKATQETDDSSRAMGLKEIPAGPGPNRLMKNLPVAGKAVLAQCTSIREVAYLVEGMFNIGYSPGPVFLRSCMFAVGRILGPEYLEILDPSYEGKMYGSGGSVANVYISRTKEVLRLVTEGKAPTSMATAENGAGGSSASAVTRNATGIDEKAVHRQWSEGERQQHVKGLQFLLRVLRAGQRLAVQQQEGRRLRDVSARK